MTIGKLQLCGDIVMTFGGTLWDLDGGWSSSIDKNWYFSRDDKVLKYYSVKYFGCAGRSYGPSRALTVGENIGWNMHNFIISAGEAGCWAAQLLCNREAVARARSARCERIARSAIRDLIHNFRDFPLQKAFGAPALQSWNYNVVLSVIVAPHANILNIHTWICQWNLVV